MSEGGKGEEGKGDDGPAAMAQFSILCYSFSMQAKVAMGLEASPVTGETAVDLGQAKSFIDILEMLKVKTEGNRTQEESKFLMGQLFDLRMLYVDKIRGK